MNKSVNKLENEIRAELMLRKSGRRTAKYGHLSNNEIYILALAMTRKLNLATREGGLETNEKAEESEEKAFAGRKA